MAVEKWSFTVFGAEVSGDTLADAIKFSASYEDAYFVGVALARRVGSLPGYVAFEVEWQAIQHLGDQQHQEFNILATARWLPFPWDQYLDTSCAIGEGGSYAIKIPEVEARTHENTSRFLNYLLLELALALPDVPQWNLVFRIHHRSGIYGLINDVEGASNALCLGVRYNF